MKCIFIALKYFVSSLLFWTSEGKKKHFHLCCFFAFEASVFGLHSQSEADCN